MDDRIEPAAGRSLTRRRSRVAWLLALMILLMFAARGQLNTSVGRVELPGAAAFTLSRVAAPLSTGASAANARMAWCVWHAFSLTPTVPSSISAPDPQATAADRAAACADDLAAGRKVQPAGDGTAGRLVTACALLGLGMLLALLVLVVVGLRAQRRNLDRKDPLGEGLCIATAWPYLGSLIVVAVLGGLVEAAAELLGLANPHAAPWMVGGAGRVLAVAIPARILAVGLLLVMWVLVAIHARLDPNREHGLIDEAERTEQRGYRHVAGLLRLQLVLVGVVVVLLSGVGNTQIQDALLRWTDIGGDVKTIALAGLGVVLGVAVTVALGLLVWRSAYRTALTDDTEQSPVPPWLVTVVGLVLVAQWLVWPHWFSLGGLGVVLLLVALLGWLAGAAPWHRRDTSAAGFKKAESATVERAHRPDQRVWERVLGLARWLAAIPLAMLGIALVRATAGPLVVGPPRAQLLFATVLGVALVVAAALLPGILTGADERLQDRFRRAADSHDQAAKGAGGQKDPDRDRHALYLTLAVASVIVYLVALLPGGNLALPVLLGPVTMAMLFAAVVLVAGNELQRWSEYAIPVSGLRVLTLRRTPVFALLAAWLVLGVLLDSGDSHAVRTIPAQTARAGPIPVTQAFNAWVDANCGRSPTAPAGEIPMVFVSASGGGIRAAYWTAGALERLFSTTASAGTCPTVPRRTRVFAASGVSGGSVGIVEWLTQLDAAQHPGRAVRAPTEPWYQRPRPPTTWYETALGADHLSASAAWLLDVDLPRLLFGYGGTDRAVMLERSWESTMPELTHGFLATYQQDMAIGWMPLALLNGTSVESGCRLVTSPLDLGAYDTTDSALSCRSRPDRQIAPHPGAPTLTDLDDFLCGGQDLTRSTAALLSARFPYISPAGRLTRCGGGERTYVVDGGYVETSASLTALDLYLAVKPLVDCHNHQVDPHVAVTGDCSAVSAGGTRRIRPVLIQIDNGYSTLATPTVTGARPNQLLVPPQTFQAVGSAAEFTARQRAFDAFGTGNYARVANIRRPGVQAPLGWVLSSGARQDLEVQLTRATTPAASLFHDTG